MGYEFDIDEARDMCDDAPGEQDEHGICPACAGSGEGQHDGTTCRACKGKGEA